MAYDGTMYMRLTTPTQAIVTCPCRHEFYVDSVEERNVVYDGDRRLLRAVCPRCGRLEDPDPHWKAARDGSRDPQPNRIAEYLD